MLRQKLKRYFELKNQIKSLETEYDAIRNALRNSLSDGSINSTVTTSEGVISLQMRSRRNRSCKWDVFKEVNPKLYKLLVTESTTKYLSIRKKKIT